MVDIITATTTFTCFNTKWKKHKLISININNLGYCFTLLFIEIQLSGIAFNEFTLAKPDKIVNPTKNTFLTNPNIFIYTMLFFFIKCL